MLLLNQIRAGVETNRISRKVLASYFAALGLIGFAIYFGGIRIKYYSDDFLFYFDPPPANLFHYFLRANPSHPFYRPLEATLLVIAQRFFGSDTLLLHLTSITVHVMLAWLVLLAMLRYRFPRNAAVMGALFMLCSEANAMAVLNNDAFSQVAGAFFGFLSILLLGCSLPEDESTDAGGVRHHAYYLLSVFAFGMSLLSKETSTFFIVAITCVVLLNRSNLKGWSTRLCGSIIQISPYAAVFAMYFGLRLFLGLQGPSFGSYRYNFHFGLNIFRNLLMFAFEAIVPVSTVSTNTALKTGNLPFLILIGVSSVVFASAVAYGVFRSERRRLLGLVAIFAILSLFPAVLMNQVSELYLYNAMPFISVIAGTGLGKLIELTKTRSTKCFVVTAVGLLFMSHVAAIRTKTILMSHNGEMAATLLNAIQPHLQSIPRNGQLVLLNPVSHEVEYSVFRMNGFNVLDDGLGRVKQIAGRNDFDVRIVSESALQKDELSGDAVVLALDTETGGVYRKR